MKLEMHLGKPSSGVRSSTISRKKNEMRQIRETFKVPVNCFFFLDRFFFVFREALTVWALSVSLEDRDSQAILYSLEAGVKNIKQCERMHILT